MSDLLVYVVIAVVAIAGAAAWLYFPKREPQVRDGQGSRHHRPGSLALSRTKKIPPGLWRLLTSGGRTTRAISAAAGSGSGTQEGAK
jgi:hypothetical protein